MLKKIECYIQPFKLEPLTQALVKIGVDGMSVTNVRGFGRQHGFSDESSDGGAAASVPEETKFREKLKLTIVVPEEMLDQTVKCIVRLAHTGKVGAGKIFIVPVEDAIRVGTGEVGYAAIM